MNKYTVYDMLSAFLMGVLVGGGIFFIVILMVK